MKKNKLKFNQKNLFQNNFNLFKLNSFVLFHSNLFKEYVIIREHILTSKLISKFGQIDLKFYLNFYFLWFFILKKMCFFFNFFNKKFFVKLFLVRYYLLCNKFKLYKTTLNTFLINPFFINFRTLTNWYIEWLFHFLIEPFFEPLFKASIFGFRPFNTFKCGLDFLMYNIKKYNLIWVLEGNLYWFLNKIVFLNFLKFLSKTFFNCFLFNYMIRYFKEEGVSSLCFNATSFFANKKILYLMGLFSNIYLTFFDNFFFEILLIFGKRRSCSQKNTLFLYQDLFYGGRFISNKYIFKYSKYLFFYLFNICIKYFRFCDTVLFGTVSSFNFILFLKIKIIHFFKFTRI